MKISKDFNQYEPWSGAIETYDRIESEGKLDELENILDELYPEGLTETELNHLLWFDEDYVFELLDIEVEE